MIAVSNASPLISLHRVDGLGLLQRLFTEVIVPPAVVREVSGRLTLPDWLNERPLAQPPIADVLRPTLGAGEREAICLALEAQASWVILDDRAGRHVARKLGLQVTGTLGVLLRSKQRGLIPAVRPALETLVQRAAAGRRVSRARRPRTAPGARRGAPHHPSCG